MLQQPGANGPRKVLPIGQSPADIHLPDSQYCTTTKPCGERFPGTFATPTPRQATNTSVAGEPCPYLSLSVAGIFH